MPGKMILDIILIQKWTNARVAADVDGWMNGWMDGSKTGYAYNAYAC